MRLLDGADRLKAVLEYCDLIDERISRYGMTQESLLANPDHADLILMPLCQIGEIAQRSRDDFELLYPDIPWHKVAGLRNVIVHGYSSVDSDLMYATIENDIPRLKEFCQSKI